MRREAEQGATRDRRADHWIYLDRSWAQRLGMTRTAGVYRIRSRELFRKLSRENLGLDTSKAFGAYENAAGFRRSA